MTPPTGSLGDVHRILRDVPAAHALHTALLLRRPGHSDRELVREARELRPACTAARVRLFLQRTDLCLVAKGDGVHLPERGLSPSQLSAPCIGASRHDEAGVATAFAEGANYVTLSPVFDSPGKGPAIGVEAFARVARAHGPLLALGGVTTSARARTLRERGASGVATISGVRAAADVSALVEPFLST